MQFFAAFTAPARWLGFERRWSAGACWSGILQAVCKEGCVHISMKPLAIALLGGGALTAAAAGMACSLVPPDALLLKQMMAKEIAFRLAVKVEQVALNDITPPALHRPLELGSDCSGLAGFHHSSGFRISVAQQQHAFATMGKPQTASGSGAGYRGRYFSGRYTGWPGAAVARNFWRAPRHRYANPTPDVDYSGYVRWPQYAGESTAKGPDPGPSPVRWSTLGVMPDAPRGPGFCRYEGVAVVLGYDISSPVTVNFTQQCDEP